MKRTAWDGAWILLLTLALLGLRSGRAAQHHRLRHPTPTRQDWATS
jgi:hypothetical protein